MIKQAEFAGSFYPEDKKVLEEMIDNFLETASCPEVNKKVVGVICPHAGYIYSGPVAGYSYKLLAAKQPEIVAILAPSHRYPFHGAATAPIVYNTPLGKVEPAVEIIEQFQDLDFVKYQSTFFEHEHSLEVQLPFLQKVSPKTKIVPFILGEMYLEEMKLLAERLAKLAEDRNMVVIVSTDLSHYLTYDQANQIDQQTITLIKEKQINKLWQGLLLGEQRACGIFPVITFLFYANALNADIQILHYANSADTASDKSRVVGYLSAFAAINQ